MTAEPCDHDWEFHDDSFDHEFGCERVHYMQCKKCDAVKECEDDSPDFCEPPASDAGREEGKSTR